ncbi:Alpha/Beta hydrolase protein [Cladorrhinum sp. PSN259]|nr:Alpha/Beta hydrolase protein [Cladorrhinum sp. PSN259]
MSEDCLYINVIRPAGIDENAQLPVAIWIHGGGLTMGGSADRRYNLSFIVENSVELGTPIITVSFNYRMAAFRFLSGPEVQASGATNLGFRDQRHALWWIQENIAAFGGSPDKSGFGGGLHRYPGGLNNTSVASTNYKKLVQATSCASTYGTPASLQCLRDLSLADLMTVLSNRALDVAIWVPAIDGDLIADYPSRQSADSRFIKVPVLVGQNTDEGASFGANRSATSGPINTDEQMAESVTRVIFGPNHPNLDNLVRELLYLYPDIQASKHGIPAWNYRLDVTNVGVPGYQSTAHFQEIPYTFSNLDGVGYARNPFEGAPKSYRTLAKVMSNTWIRFFVSIDPTAGTSTGRIESRVVQWPRYNPAEGGGVGRNIVWDGSKISYMEWDSFRAEGVNWMIENSLSALGT